MLHNGRSVTCLIESVCECVLLVLRERAAFVPRERTAFLLQSVYSLGTNVRICPPQCIS